jgi:predicted Zn-dependent protease
MGLLALDEVAAAMQAGERWTRASSDSPGLWEASGAAALAAGDWHAAQTRYGRVVALASGSPWELAAAGEAILRTGLAARRRAIAEIGLGAMQKAAGPEQSPTLLHDYGRALLACRRYDEGLDALRRAAAAAPQSRALNNALAEAERARQGP